MSGKASRRAGNGARSIHGSPSRAWRRNTITITIIVIVLGAGLKTHTTEAAASGPGLRLHSPALFRSAAHQTGWRAILMEEVQGMKNELSKDEQAREERDASSTYYLSPVSSSNRPGPP